MSTTSLDVVVQYNQSGGERKKKSMAQFSVHTLTLQAFVEPVENVVVLKVHRDVDHIVDVDACGLLHLLSIHSVYAYV